MHHTFLLSLSLLYIPIAHAMEQQPDPLTHAVPRTIPKLYEICMNQLSAGFGNNEIEKHANALQNLATLYKIHKEGSYKYSLGHNELEIIKNNMAPNHICFNTNKNNRHKNIATPFLVKHDNGTFFVQDNFTDIAKLHIESGETEIVRQKKSFIWSCIKTEKTNLLINGNHDGTINVGPINSKEYIHKEIHTGAIECLAEADNLLCSALDNSIKIWHLLDDMPAYKIICTLNLFGIPTVARSIIFRNKLLYTGSSHGHINVQDIRFEAVGHTYKAHNDRVSCLITCKHNDRHFYSGSFDGSIKKWDLRNLKECAQSFGHQKYGIACMYETNDGKKIYSGGADGIRIWNVSDGQSPLQPQEMHAVYTTINNKIKPETTLQYVDCITANDDESELYIANVPSRITVLRQPNTYTIEETIENIT